MSLGFPVPIFFSETGCITAPPRTWADMASILGPDMDSQWSGAMAYEWIQEDNDYGIIEYGVPQGDTFGRSGTPTPIVPDFTNLQSQWATLNPTGVKLSDYSASLAAISTPACPGSTAGAWELDGNPALPVVGAAYTPTATQAADSSQTNSAATATATASGTSAGTSTTSKANANGGKEIAGMSVGLSGVLMGILLWL